MPKIHLDSSDGRYYTRQLTDAEVAEHEAHGLDVVYVEDAVWETYRRDCERDSIWQAFWRTVANEQSMRRREKELMPLEDAEREIARLKEELARAKRMEQFYEEQYTKQLGERHREEYVEYTCVYPVPGCQVDALPDEWRERARELLEQYRADHAEEGMKRQGCCCSLGNHRLLDAAAAQGLRDAGFLVENDTEVA